MMTKLSELVEHGFDHWKLDGVYCPGENFVKITEYFVKACDLIQMEHLHSDQAPICLMKKSANYIQLIVVWILVSMIMNQIVCKITNNTRASFVSFLFLGTKRRSSYRQSLKLRKHDKYKKTSRGFGTRWNIRKLKAC